MAERERRMTKTLCVKDLDIVIEASDSTFQPMCKKPTLAIRKENQVIKVASFNNLNSAEFFMDSVEKMFMQMNNMCELKM